MTKKVINYLDGSAPHDPLYSILQPGYNFKRGKVLPKARSSWDAVDANGKSVDHEGGKNLLDEALGN